jgi:hypothetical protein
MAVCLGNRRACPGQHPQNVLVVLDHSVQAFWFASKQTRNELNVSVPRGSGGSPIQSLSGMQRHSGTPQVSLHSDGVDQLPHDPNCAGQLLEAWQVEAVAIAASRIASGSLVNAARSISGVGWITARGIVSVVSSVGDCTSMLEAAGDGAVGGAWLVWPAASHAHRPHAIAMTAARDRIVMMSFSVV